MMGTSLNLYFNRLTENISAPLIPGTETDSVFFTSIRKWTLAKHCHWAKNTPKEWASSGELNCLLEVWKIVDTLFLPCNRHDWETQHTAYVYFFKTKKASLFPIVSLWQQGKFV